MTEVSPPTASAHPSRVNVFGRRAGRGWRPWILVPKVLAVGLLFGGLAAVLTLIVTADLQTPQQWAHLAGQLSRVYMCVIVPGAGAAVVCGVMLFLQAPRVLFAQRWMKIKLLALGHGLPMLHISAAAAMHKIRGAVPGPDPFTPPATALAVLRTGAIVGLVLVVIVVILGRQKPRLGQNWAKKYAKLEKRAARRAEKRAARRA